MGNNLNNNLHNINLKINKDEYWDFFINKDSMNFSNIVKGLQDKCLISYIDTDDSDCVYLNELYSKKQYVWEDAQCTNINLCNIGYVGVDNGLISFKKDRITNEEFYNLYTKSSLKIEENDKRLHLYQVTGNTMQWEYPLCTIIDDKFQAIKLNGGFYQGFFKLYGNNYQVLPDKIKSDWNLEFTLKKKNYKPDSDITLNSAYPNNKGIFFYMGTRAENKWWLLYGKDKNETFKKRCNISYFEDDYTNNDYYQNNGSVLNSNYLQDGKPYIEKKPIPYSTDDYFINEDYLNHCPYNKDIVNTTGYFIDQYVQDDEFKNLSCINDYLLDNDYIQEDMFLDEKTTLTTCDGYKLDETNIFEIKTDNKFILFNRTPTGFTVDNFDKNSEYLLTGQTQNTDKNYFTLFNRTPTGFTTHNINTITNELNNIYKVYDDIRGNCFAFRIKDDGSIGYRYLTINCNKENKIDIIEEYSSIGLVKENEWCTIDVRIKMDTTLNNIECSKNSKRKMVFYFYINGFLKFISKELPEFNFKQLTDIKEKQEGVPYNISLGGGTQGLCDMITINYQKIPEYVLPLEENFAGTFIGELKSFKFYNCALNYSEIVNNVEFEKNSIE